MAKLPLGERISREDFGEVPKDLEDILDRLLTPLNNFMQTVYDAMNANLTVPDNIAASYKSFRIRGGAVADDNTFQFLHGLKFKPKGCWVIAATRPDGLPILSPIYIAWQPSQKYGTIDIVAISMLSAGVDYDITVRVE